MLNQCGNDLRMIILLIIHSIWWLWLHVCGYSYLWCYKWSDVISYRLCICPFPGYIVFVTYTSNNNITPKALHWCSFSQILIIIIFDVYWCGWYLSLTWTEMRYIGNCIYIWRWWCVYLPRNFSSQCTCALTIGKLIFCLTIHY